MASNGTLTTKKRVFIAALSTCTTVRAAAKKAGIGERTAWRWLDDPDIKAAVNERQTEVLAQVTRVTVASMTEALDVLRGIMLDVNNPPTPRVTAARAILETGLRFKELVELAERIARLEARIDGE